jgi:hypothetical protein
MNKLTLFATAAASVLVAAVPGYAGWRAIPSEPICSVITRTPDGFLALRDGPGTEFPMFNQLYPGDVVLEAEYDGRWVHIISTLRRGPINGWAHGAFLVRTACPNYR